MALRSCFVHQKVMIACSTQAPAPPRRPLTIASLNNQIPKSVLGLGAALTVGLGAFTVTPASAFARSNILPPIDFSDSERCLPSQLDKFAQTRAKFSLEAGSGDVKELLVDIRECNLSDMDLSTKVFSGVIMERANFENSKIRAAEMSRTDAREANLRNVDFTDTNAYAANFDGADLENAQFENSILSNASFGKGPTNGQWANLKGAHFEGALVSSSDVKRMCQNPTLSEEARDFELGC